MQGKHNLWSKIWDTSGPSSILWSTCGIPHIWHSFYDIEPFTNKKCVPISGYISSVMTWFCFLTFDIYVTYMASLNDISALLDWRIYDIPFELDRQISTVLFGQIPALLEWPTALVASLAPNLLPRHQTNHSPSISIQCPRSVNLLMIFLSFSLLLITNSFL